jgi:hypothetical protein
VIVFGILLIVAGLALLAARGPLVEALRGQSAKGIGPQPSRGLATGVYMLCAVAVVSLGVVVLAGVLPGSG